MKPGVAEATCEELLLAGWGSVERASIPANWREVPGPDFLPKQSQVKTIGRGKWIRKLGGRYGRKVR